MPIRARELWLGHVGALVACGGVVVAVTLGVIALHDTLLVKVDLGRPGWTIAPTLMLGLVLAVLLSQAPRPALAQIPASVGYSLWTIAVIVGTPLLLTWTGGLGLAGLALLTGLVGTLAVVLYRAVPATYTLAPHAVGAPPTAVTFADGPAPRGLRGVVAFTVLRSLSAGAKELLAVPILLILGAVLGGGLLTIGDEAVGELRFLYLPISIYMLFALIGPRLSSLHYLDALPISRRPLIATLLLPYFLLLCVGYGVGTWFSGDARSRLEYVSFEELEGSYRVTVPLRVYETAREGSIPDATSPWGERHALEGLRVLDSGSAMVYSPYGTSSDSSARFVALQLSRAIEQVYGRSIPAKTIERNYLTTRADGTVAPRGGGISLRVDYPELQARSGPLLPVLVTLVAVPWLLLVALLLRAYRHGIREWVRQTIVWGCLGLLLALWIAGSVGTTFGAFQPWAFRAAVEIPVMRMGQTTAGWVVVWLAAGVLLAGAYALAQAQFQRMEIPTHPSRYTLIRAGQDREALS